MGPMAQARPQLKPEMTANVQIIVADRRDVVTVPSDALVRKGGQQFVTLANADGTTQEQAVTIGITDGALVEIVSGLEAGQTVQLRQGGGSRWTGQAGQNRPAGGMMPGMMGGGGGRR